MLGALLEGRVGLYDVLSSPRDFLSPLQWSKVFQGVAADGASPAGLWFQHFLRV